MTAIQAKSPATRSTAPAPLTALQKAQALMKEYAAVSAEHDGLLAQAKKVAEPLKKRLEELETQLNAWSQDATNAAEFGGNKMLKTDWGTFGFKAGTKKLAWNLDTTPEDYQNQMEKLVKRFLPTALSLKVDEGKVAKLWKDTPKLSQALAELGCSVEQDDKFTIVLAKEKTKQALIQVKL